jgi:hypothetical protein
MRVRFQPLQTWVNLQRVLRADGWHFEGDSQDVVIAEHPNVADESAVRKRLGRLGLLTSVGLRIEFLPAVGSRAVRQCSDPVR